MKTEAVTLRPRRASADRGEARLIARARADDQLFTIHAPDLPRAAGDSALASTELFRLEPLRAEMEDVIWPLHPARAYEGPLLGASVRRLLPGGRVALGSVSAIRGAAELRDPGTGLCFMTTDLIEVTFHTDRQELGKKKSRLPELELADAGRIVISDENEAVGLVVGGSGYVAVVAPLDRLLAARDLDLVNAEEVEGIAPDQTERALLQTELKSLVDQLAVLPRLDFEI